jgi:hypothetical protein
MWVNRNLESILKEKLISQFDKAEGDEFYGFYTTARVKLVENLLEEIKAIIPKMSDHGSRHIADVIDNAERLLGNDINKYSGLEIYTLLVAILFHDVGNIYGREKHNKKIADIYNIVRLNDVYFSRERHIITKIAEAHCGLSKDNTTDTLGDVAVSDHIKGQQVKMRELSAILRLSDELAEGKQRTSLFWNKINPEHYPMTSQVFHKYASICNVFIDEGNGRISLSYDIEISDFDQKSFFEIMEFVYDRIIKLDEERKYCKFYNAILNKFKAVHVQFNFTKDGNHIEESLENLVLNDLQKPGAHKTKIHELNKEYELPTLWSKLTKTIKQVEA